MSRCDYPTFHCNSTYWACLRAPSTSNRCSCLVAYYGCLKNSDCHTSATRSTCADQNRRLYCSREDLCPSTLVQEDGSGWVAALVFFLLAAIVFCAVATYIAVKRGDVADLTYRVRKSGLPLPKGRGPRGTTLVLTDKEAAVAGISDVIKSASASPERAHTMLQGFSQSSPEQQVQDYQSKLEQHDAKVAHATRQLETEPHKGYMPTTKSAAELAQAELGSAAVQFEIDKLQSEILHLTSMSMEQEKADLIQAQIDERKREMIAEEEKNMNSPTRLRAAAFDQGLSGYVPRVTTSTGALLRLGSSSPERGPSRGDTEDFRSLSALHREQRKRNPIEAHFTAPPPPSFSETNHYGNAAAQVAVSSKQRGPTFGGGNTEVRKQQQQGLLHLPRESGVSSWATGSKYQVRNDGDASSFSKQRASLATGELFSSPEFNTLSKISQREERDQLETIPALAGSERRKLGLTGREGGRYEHWQPSHKHHKDAPPPALQSYSTMRRQQQHQDYQGGGTGGGLTPVTPAIMGGGMARTSSTNGTYSSTSPLSPHKQLRF